MTAVVAILNKSGVAIAADSAVTIQDASDERKIYNTANKIFTLSKFHPISIMIYSSDNFNGIPWEILIKEYRKKLGKQSFGTLREYRNDFMNYIKKRIDLIPQYVQLEYLNSFFDYVMSDILEAVVEQNLDQINAITSDDKKIEFTKEKIVEFLEIHLDRLKKRKLLKEFSAYRIEEFLKIHQDTLDQIFKNYFGKLDFDTKTQRKLYKLIFKLISTDHFFGNFTGLVFAGFGEDQIFPACISLKVGEVFDDRIRYMDYQEMEISYKTNSAIIPFAQRDVIDLILSGIDSNIQEIINETFEMFLKEFIDRITSKINTDNKTLAEKIKSIDVEDLVKSFISEIRIAQENIHVQPLVSSVSTLSKEDLAELAESLIYLTYLKRRMSFSEESVGGPVDVAVISKGDGFIWLKRKHYFDPKLNPGFINNYFNH